MKKEEKDKKLKELEELKRVQRLLLRIKIEKRNYEPFSELNEDENMELLRFAGLYL